MICPGIKVTTYISASDLCPSPIYNYINCNVLSLLPHPHMLSRLAAFLFVDKKFLKAREHRFCLMCTYSTVTLHMTAT